MPSLNPAPSGKPDLSIILAGADRRTALSECLDAVLENATPRRLEVVVVGEAEPPVLGGAEAVPVRRIDSTGHGLWADANRGAREANGGALLFLDCGVRLLPGWLEPLLGTLESDPHVTAVGPGLLSADAVYVEAGRCLVEGMPRGAGRLQWMPLAAGRPLTAPETMQPRRVTALGPGCLMVRRRDFEAAGGFDENYERGWATEDLCLRLAGRDRFCVARPEAKAFLAADRFRQRADVAPEADPDLRRFADIWSDRIELDFRRDEDGGLVPQSRGGLEAYAPPLAVRDIAPRTGDATATIVVLTWNALDCTRDCVASLLRHTDPRHEILIVDNGSDEPMQRYLDELERGEPRIAVIRNGGNLGFAAGNNVGVAAARGDHVCLLNSDTVVTAGWLERMLAVLEQDPAIGLVGPVTNHITGGQQLESVDYDPRTLQGLDDFAAARSGSEAGRFDEALWIVGFCVVIRGELVERIGGLDERFGQGNYEDTDYCLRAFLAGWRCAVAHDAFVHHHGSRSFAEGGVALDRLLDEKFEVFRRKWELPASARETGDFDLKRHLLRGYLPPLHFCPLPAGPVAVNRTPESWELDAWCDRGETAFGQQQWRLAEGVLRGVLRWDPHHGRAANDLACTLWRQETEADPATCDGTDRLAEAEAILADLAAREPGNGDAAWNLEEIRTARRELERRPLEVR